ncbi:sugar ABC transporter ATP-binding protein [Pleomorphomonas sp. JP5]|uniref:sugar ABC transporter ATP-binding protein n=1 Tax=Pleomorphomonas sp. JP5 TaxID=2942998 RepID=UPI002042F94E|nr:sugar ABC transporter ATP-binding protein [Pleomorphomonas sp. JP5]MCM5558932.1 sugar ABC transporter ATP-binding protein [Pleomorphomonas sp. JP5]
MTEVGSSTDLRRENHLLELRNIHKSFSSVEVLKGVDFDLRQGEIHALIGHNGAGKSTLIKVVSGLYPDYSGSIAINSKSVDLRTPHAAADNQIAVIYQDFALVPEFTVAENIALGREPGRLGGFLLPHGDLRRRSEREIAEFELDVPLDTPVRHLGVAGKQMTEIAKALARRARVLIMDEPTARLAPHERTRLFEIMRRLAASGVGIIYVSHFLDEIKEVTDRVTVLRDGAVVASAATESMDIEDMARLLTGDEKTMVSAARPVADKCQERSIGKAILELIDFSVHGRPPANLALAPGEIVGVAGLVGSGRTSLARAILGDIAASGTLRIDGEAIGKITPGRAARYGIAMVPEDRKLTGLALQASIASNMELTALGTYLGYWGLVRRDLACHVIEDAIDRFRILPKDPGRPVGHLSGGNAQKVLMARAALAKPKVLLLDQPTAGVDIGAKSETHRQIRALAETGTAVLLISDDLDELLSLSDRIAVMTEGALGAVVDTTNFNRSTLLAAISQNVEKCRARAD